MIKRYFANKDNTITNAYQADLVTRGTGSNMGQSDILEVFTIYGQVSSSASGLQREKSRILVQFDTAQILSDKNTGAISSGSAFYLKLYNAKHSQTLPRDFTLTIHNLNADWQEGLGLDMENYSDLTYDIRGSNWIRRSGSTSWGTEGGGVGSVSYSTTFPIGNENLEVNVTSLVNQWLDSSEGSEENNGFLIRMDANLAAENRSYYTKKFFARRSHNWFERPVLEARWDSAKLDDRGSFYLSSSLAPPVDNLNTLYLYNYVRGRLTNIPSIGTATHGIMVSLFSGSANNSTLSGSALKLSADGTYVSSTSQYVVTGGWVSTGIYSASFAYTGSSTIETIYDVWFSGSSAIVSATGSSLQFSTGSTDIKRYAASLYTQTPSYVLSIPNRNQEYYYNQTHRIRVYARERSWSPNIYDVATNIPNSLVFESSSYQIYRIMDNKVVIPYDTGSNQATRLSYDVSGNYFDLDASILEPNYSYGVKFSIYDSDTLSYEEQPFVYKLRVVKNEY